MQQANGDHIFFLFTKGRLFYYLVNNGMRGLLKLGGTTRWEITRAKSWSEVRVSAVKSKSQKRDLHHNI